VIRINARAYENDILLPVTGGM